MSLRDWFAGQALTGLIVRPITTVLSDGAGTSMATDVEGYAKCAYFQADAMIAAREGKQ